MRRKQREIKQHVRSEYYPYVKTNVLTSVYPPAPNPTSTKQVVTKVITVVQTVVDGKVVESSKTVDVDVDEIET